MLYVAFVIVPIGASVVLSMFRWDGVNTPVWVGFSNYRLRFTDQVLRSSLIHPALLLIFYCVLPLVFALALSTALTNIKRGQATFRLIISCRSWCQASSPPSCGSSCTSPRPA